MIAEELELFLADFGVEVVFTRGGNPVTTATAIYDAPASEINVYDRSFYDEKFYEARLQGSSVTLLAVEADLVNVAAGDTATINAVGWVVTSKEPDGTGLITIRLSLHSI